jgi:hypothetical protein
VPASVEVIAELSFQCCLGLTKLGFESGSHLREMLDVPTRWAGVCEMPDSVTTVNASSLGKSPGPLVLKFGRDSQLQQLKVRTSRGNATSRGVLEVAPRFLKTVRRRLEFPPFLI